jgi:phage FluMu gp28-like protein
MTDAILLPYQKAWIEDTAQVTVWEKSQRIGASYGEALASVLEAAKAKEAGGQSTYSLLRQKLIEAPIMNGIETSR